MLSKTYLSSHKSLSRFEQKQLLKLFKQNQLLSDYKQGEIKDPLFLKSQAFYILSKQEDNICAYLIYKETQADHIEIWQLAVGHKYWGLGIADELMKYFYTKVLQSKQAASLEVSTSNRRAVELYERNHWSIMRRRNSYYADASDALIMGIKKAL